MPVPRPAKFDAVNATIIGDDDDDHSRSHRNNSSSSSSNKAAISVTNTTATAPPPPPSRPPPPPPPSPHQDLLLLTPSEASHMRNLFIAKGQALAERAATANSSLPSPPASTDGGGARRRLLLRIPHLDEDDDSVREHYESCEVCRGIRRRAVPDEHEYWTRVNEMGEGKVREMRVGGVVTRSSGRGAAAAATAAGVKTEGSEE